VATIYNTQVDNCSRRNGLK